MPLVGQIANKVPQNPKCNGCVHYGMGRSVCEIGLAPSSCGDGSMPDVGYSPLSTLQTDVDQAERPSHATPSSAGGVPSPQERIAIITSHLGDDSELLAMAKSMSKEMAKSCQSGCAVHQHGQTGQFNMNTYGVVCSCRKLDKSFLAERLHDNLPPRERRKVSKSDLVGWVEARIDDLVSNPMIR